MPENNFFIVIKFDGDGKEAAFCRSMTSQEQMALDVIMKIQFDLFKKNLIKFRKETGDHLCPN